MATKNNKWWNNKITELVSQAKEELEQAKTNEQNSIKLRENQERKLATLEQLLADNKE